jgi:hypothetical protein
VLRYHEEATKENKIPLRHMKSVTPFERSAGSWLDIASCFLDELSKGSFGPEAQFR